MNKRAKSNGSWRDYKAKRLVIQKYPELKDTIEDFWKEIKLCKI